MSSSTIWWPDCLPCSFFLYPLDMLPTYHRLDDSEKFQFHVPFARVAIIGLSLPLGAFVFCVLWSINFDFVRATFTHCEVPNYLPSVSAAIGNFEPQKTVWRLAILLHMPLRLLAAKFYFEYYKRNIRRNRRVFGVIACTLNVIENLALFGLSLWTSADNYEIHRNSFVTFIACSEVYMLISYFLNKNARKAALLPVEEKSLQLKRNLFLINVLAFGIAGYCFMRHNARCEPGVYTFFALFEYIIVLTNMGYHMTAYWDFYSLTIVYDPNRGFYLTQM